MASGVISFPAAAATCLLLLAAFAASSAWAAPQVFVVGGEPKGWRKPAPNDETYNHWAARNRFHVGDFLHFKYDKSNESVLVVSRDDYKLCGAAKPAQQFRDGDTRFRLDRSGFFYFLSGEPGHCDAGQRMAVRVTAAQQEDAAPPAEPPAVAMSPGGTDEGGYSGESKPAPGAAGSVSISKQPPPPPPQGSDGGDGDKNGAAASTRAPAFVVVGAVLGFVLMCLAP